MQLKKRPDGSPRPGAQHQVEGFEAGSIAVIRNQRISEGKMPAYMIALNRSVHDLQKLEAYWKAAGPTFEGRSSKSLSIYTPVTPLELMGPLEGVVLIEFPDVAAAKAWYESPAYQEAKKHRDGAADTEFFIIDGGRVAAGDRLPHIRNR
jgi:uncharacterized protein (DUF1330 family)